MLKFYSWDLYDISDKKYAPMKGTIKVDGGKQSNGDL